MKNSEIRAWYQKRVADIYRLNLEWIAQGIGLNERALRAWRIRHDARIEARSMMENIAELEDLRERDRRLYGSPDCPTFRQLVEQNYGRGFQGDEVYERIISGSQSTNRVMNKLLNLEGPSEY